MTALFWHGVILGGYVTHGETYLNEDEIIYGHMAARSKEQASRASLFAQHP